MTPSPDLAELIEIIAADTDLQRALTQEKSTDAFASACVLLAEKRNLRVTTSELCELLRARTIAWHQRHLR